MKCRKFECQAEASTPFLCCGMTHGVTYRDSKRDIETYQTHGGSFRDYYNLMHWSLEKIMYYAQFIN